MKRPLIKSAYLSLMASLLFATEVLASSSVITDPVKTGSIYGVVRAQDGSKIEFASVVLKPSGLYSMTDANGNYEIKEVPSGSINLSIQFFGMEEIDTTFTMKRGEHKLLNFKMKETSFRLDKVTVVATRNEAGHSTASEISRQAMDHMQTSSLKDVMGLLPGVAISNPDLSSAQFITIRNNAGGSSMNSLGTAIIVDGAPMSNNANLQMLTTAQSGSTMDNNTNAASASAGVDIRGLSTDNIESVEVIRGIPSVQYGDLTSGAVLVKSKAGKSPLVIRFKTNPNIYQASATKGINLGKKAGDLNISGDYAYNQSKLTESTSFYQRANVKGLWSVMFGHNSTANTSLGISYGKDTQKLNPDARDKTRSHSSEVGLQFNTNGHAFLNRGWLKSLNWLVSGSYNGKDSHFESVASNAMNLYSTAMNDGAVYTNTPGQHLFDASGNEITNSASTGISGNVLPYSYFYKYDIDGKEVNVFAKANADFSKTWNNFTEKFLIGADFKSDGNLGKGASYDDDLPPYRNISNTASGFRKRHYYDIPFVNQLGGYFENTFDFEFAERHLNVTAGARFDWINDLTSLSPRVNASFDIFPWMTARGGWGFTSKAPTSIMLNPNYAYLDDINYNGMDVNYPDNEQLLIATTHVYSAKNNNLEIARNRKVEAGFDFRIAKRYQVSITAYDEYMDNGYSFGLSPDSFIWYQHKAYKEVKHNTGTSPTVAVDSTYNLFFKVYKPGNNLKVRNSGIEYEINLGRFDGIRTSFYINGAWTRGSSTSKGYSFSTISDTRNVESNIGIYNPEVSTSHYENLLTTFRATHNIPKIGFVITLTSQVDWWSKSWDTFKNDDMFVKYISRKDGKIHPFDASMKENPEYSYLFPTLSDSRFITEKTFPYVMFNLNITKEIGDWMTASFYVNNIFNHRPLYRSKASGTKSELGIPIFFGFELKVSIK
ncbi:MAG: TonB-dependent receptor [Bacteroidales bacterium]|nr:TonB-dependent receptor [Bacteroidales bacterium]MCI1785288.1 TonB-dependent receptor [Bacteroidales bacterium]